MSDLKSIVPQNLGVKYNPPVIYLTYELNQETLFHEFPLTANDLRLPMDTLYNKLSAEHPGYLEHIEPAQMCKFIKLIKDNQKQQPKKSSRAQQLRHMVHGAKKVEDYNKQIDDIDLFSPDDDHERRAIFP